MRTIGNESHDQRIMKLQPALERFRAIGSWILLLVFCIQPPWVLNAQDGDVELFDDFTDPDVFDAEWRKTCDRARLVEEDGVVRIWFPGPKVAFLRSERVFTGDVSVRTLVRAVGPDSTTGCGVHTTGVLCLPRPSATGYGMLAGRRTPWGLGPNVVLIRSDPGDALVTDLEVLDCADLPPDFDPSEEHFLQIETRGDWLEGRVWRPGEPFPEEPLLRARDATYRSGTADVSYLSPRSGDGVNRYAVIEHVRVLQTATPVATFTVDVLNGEAPLTVGVDGSGSTAPAEHQVVSYDWDFGDGGSAEGASASHTYGLPGRYDLRLTITDSRGSFASTTKRIDVLPASHEPAPWKTADIGDPGFPGSAELDEENRLVITAGGEFFFGSSDDFHLVYQELEGDGSITFRLHELRPAGVGSGVDAVVGVMLRESLDPNSRYAAMSVSRTNPADGTLDGISTCAGRDGPDADALPGVFEFHHRTRRSTGVVRGRPVDLTNVWVSLERQGDELVALTSIDGETWSELDRRTLDLPRKILAAIALSAGNGFNTSGVVRAVVEVEIEGVGGAGAFVRADCNGDSRVDLSDAVCILNWLFSGGEAPGCIAATNTSGDDAANITDATYLLNHLFSGGPAPAQPFPDCGSGPLPADEDLGCANPPDCR